MEIPNEVFGQPNNTLYISSWTKFCVFKIPKLHLFHSRKLSLSWVVTVTQHSVMCPVGFHSSAQFSSVSRSCPTLCDPMDHSSSGLPVHHQLLELAPGIKSVMPSNHLILCGPLLLLPSIFPSIRVFSDESFLRIRWPKYWSFSFSISPSNEYSGLISFTIDWFDFLAVQGTLKSLLPHHRSKASVLIHSSADGHLGCFHVRGGFGIGNTCTPVADSCWCMAKPIQYCKVK